MSHSIKFKHDILVEKHCSPSHFYFSWHEKADILLLLKVWRTGRELEDWGDAGKGDTIIIIIIIIIYIILLRLFPVPHTVSAPPLSVCGQRSNNKSSLAKDSRKQNMKLRLSSNFEIITK